MDYQMKSEKSEILQYKYKKSDVGINKKSETNKHNTCVAQLVRA